MSTNTLISVRGKAGQEGYDSDSKSHRMSVSRRYSRSSDHVLRRATRHRIRGRFPVKRCSAVLSIDGIDRNAWLEHDLDFIGSPHTQAERPSAAGS
jgi:hypothetical protein